MPSTVPAGFRQYQGCYLSNTSWDGKRAACPNALDSSGCSSRGVAKYASACCGASPTAYVINTTVNGKTYSLEGDNGKEMNIPLVVLELYSGDYDCSHLPSSVSATDLAGSPLTFFGKAKDFLSDNCTGPGCKKCGWRVHGDNRTATASSPSADLKCNPKASPPESCPGGQPCPASGVCPSVRLKLDEFDAALRLFVDPSSGHDRNDGLSATSALRSLALAQQRLRQALNESSHRSIVVHLLPGRHRVPKGGLLLEPGDSTADGHGVYWRGHQGATSLSGGEPVTGWKLAGDPTLPKNVYRAPAPAALRGKTARHLFVDGLRAVRTRQNASVLGLALDTHPGCVACSYSASSAAALSWSNPSDVEMVYSGVLASWAEERCSVESVTAAAEKGTNITMKQPCFWNLVKGKPLTMGNVTPAWVENVREHLKAPGQWYYDKAKAEVLYYPLQGQDLSKADAILAVEETLVKHDGAQNHNWHGVTFEYATWLRPMQGAGYVEAQTGACDICPYGVELQDGCGKHDTFVVAPGNVVVSSGRNVEFVNCSYEHLGAYAASALNGSQNVSWRGCTFQDVSAGAVALGDVTTWDIADTSRWDKDFVVEDCLIANLPVEYTGAAAVFGGYVDSTTIAHNHIANTTYSGISLGWGWGHEASGRGNNHVIANHIERVLLSGRCCDGGGIYTLGPQPGSSLTGNYLFHADSPKAHVLGRPGYGPFGHGGHAIYHDEGSGGFTDTHNVIDGPWDAWNTVRPFGWKCLGASGRQVDCLINVTENWARSNGTSACSTRSATCRKVDPGFIVAGNVRLNPGAPFPAAASAIAVAAGPRYAVGIKTEDADAAGANICGQNKTIGQAVIAAMNLSTPGLRQAASAAASGDLGKACQAIADYYRQGKSSSWLRIGPVAPGTSRVGGATDAMVDHDIYQHFPSPAGPVKIPRTGAGGLNWIWWGPDHDDEFMNVLNRHASFTDLLGAWNATGNAVYAKYFSQTIADWVLNLPCANASEGHHGRCLPLSAVTKPSAPVCSWAVDSGGSCATGTFESPWRSLEMGIRMAGPWPAAFFGFQQADAFTTDARVLLLLGVAEHFQGLLVDGGHPGRGTVNWEMTQWRGLLSAAAAFPEVAGAAKVAEASMAYLTAFLQSGVYADGVETEMASGYDMGTASDYFSSLKLNKQAGLPDPPAAYVNRVEAMYTYGAYISDPSGYMPMNGDSDLHGNGYDRETASYFKRPDWSYVHTNGAEGTAPKGPAPSSMFPWAGQCALRSGWEKNASWLWFDVGPFGSNPFHAHRDKLTVLLHSHGSTLIEDSGRFAYAGNSVSHALRPYCHDTHAHNTLRIDGMQQSQSPKLATSPRPNSSWTFQVAHDIVQGSMSEYDGLHGTAKHSRTVYHQRGDFFLIVDIVTSDRPRAIQATWHTHPNASVSLAADVATIRGVDLATQVASDVHVALIPATGAQSWNSSKIVKGQRAGVAGATEDQGWFSEHYSDATPASTLVYDAQMSSSSKRAAFAWLLVVSPTGRPAAASCVVTDVGAEEVSATVTVAGKAQKVTVPFEPGR